MKGAGNSEISADLLTEASRRAPGLERADVDYGMLASLTGFRVKLSWIIGYSLLNRVIDDPAVTPQRFSLLEIVGSNPGLSQVQLASALGLSRPATTLAIDFWQDRGCMDRRTDPGDRRSFGIYLTELGKSELDRLRSLVSRADEALTEVLSEDEIAQLHRILAKIHR